MNQPKSKKGIRWMIFKLFGPPEVKELLGYIDEISQAGYDTAIYPLGEFPFHVRTSLDDDIEPMIFPTAYERLAFHRGLQYGVDLMGGTTGALTEDQYETLGQMQKKATHGGGNA